MKLILVISSLSVAGGAERVLSIMANYWAQKGWDITVATFDDGKSPSFYDLHPAIKHDSLNLSRASMNILAAIINNIKRVVKLNFYFRREKPDLIISFSYGANLLCLVSTLPTKIPVIVSERNDPSSKAIHPIKQKLRQLLYRRAKAVVCQTPKMLDYFSPAIQRISEVIPNPVVIHESKKDINTVSLPEGRILFAMGSMRKEKIYQKGFDLLIPVFARLVEKYDDWNLVILGDGPDRFNLEQMVGKLHLEQRVYLTGNIKNVQYTLSQGDLFVLSSRYEGFPNALCEAMACGLPVVSFDCQTGPSDIIRNGVDGMLVPAENVKELEKALGFMMGDEELREKTGANAKEVVERFGLEKVMNMWEELIKNLP